MRGSHLILDARLHSLRLSIGARCQQKCAYLIRHKGKDVVKRVADAHVENMLRDTWKMPGHPVDLLW